MILGIQLIGILASLFMLYIVFLNKKREAFTVNESNFWTVFWVAFLLLSLFPHSLDFIVKGVLGFSRTLDFFIVGVLMFVVIAIFYSYMQIRKTQVKMGEIVSKIAIDKAYKKKK